MVAIQSSQLETHGNGTIGGSNESFANISASPLYSGGHQGAADCSCSHAIHVDAQSPEWAHSLVIVNSLLLNGLEKGTLALPNLRCLA